MKRIIPATLALAIGIVGLLTGVRAVSADEPEMTAPSQAEETPVRAAPT